MSTPLANASAIRASGYSARVFAAFYAPQTPVASGTIFTAPGAPYTDIGVTYVVGSHTDVLYGMEVVFLDQITGLLKGRTHVRYAGVINVNNLPIREYALAQFDLIVGDTFQIFAEWRVHDKLPAATVTFDPDWLAYVDQNANPPPVACSGGHYAAFVDGYDTATVLAYATVQMTGSTSYTVDPDSGGSVTHLWTLPTGVTFAGGSANTDADPVLHAVPGEYLIYHDVTDSSNSTTTTQHIIIEVYDDTRAPYEVGITQYTGTPDGGFSFGLELMSGDGSLTAIPDGCWCILFTHEIVNGAWQAFRNAAPGRENILGVGIVRRDTSSGDASGYNKLVLEVISPLARLRELTSYSKVMLDGVLSEWDSIKTLGVLRGVEQVVLFYTTLIEAGCDVLFDADFLDYRYPALYLQLSDFYGQVKELLHGVDAVMTCDRTGRVDIHTYPPYIPLADRGAVTTSWHFVPNDILTYSFTRERVDSVAVLKSSGFTGGASSNQPIFSWYPGLAPGEALSTPVSDRLIATDQTDLNERTGRYGAEADQIYRDADGTLWRMSALNLTLRGVYNFFDFSKQFADFTTTLSTRIGFDLTAFQFFLTSIDVSFDASGAPQTKCVFKPAFNASAGATYIPPNIDTNIPTLPLPPPINISLPPAFPVLPGRGVQNMAIFTASGVLLTTDFQTRAIQGGPTYVYYSWAGLGLSGTYLGWCPRGGTSPAAGWVLTTTKLYNFEIVTQTLTHLYDFAHTTNYRSFDAGFPTSGILFAVSSYVEGVGVEVMTTPDNSSFTETSISANYCTSTGVTIYPGCFVDTRSGKVYTSRFTATTNLDAETSEGRQKTSFGTPNAALTLTSGISLAQFIHVPWNNNSDAAIIYYSAFAAPNAGAGSHHFYRNATDITPATGGYNYAPRGARDTVASSVANRQRMIAVLQDSNGTYILFLSNDAGTNWTVIDNPTDFHRCALSGDDPNTGWAWGASNGISQLTISGTTITEDSRTGNLAGFSPGELNAIAGY